MDHHFHPPLDNINQRLRLSVLFHLFFNYFLRSGRLVFEKRERVRKAKEKIEREMEFGDGRDLFALPLIPSQSSPPPPRSPLSLF
ncbi:hypothetical protein YC2023_059806 [Brassica napus]|uniref:(rape) hypothetical protein n=1 Tax=Brassica napus TaxID=3708 RepID=A0A816LBQ1_BRANA|nr:unnamed protein product [Brassica napus]